MRDHWEALASPAGSGFRELDNSNGGQAFKPVRGSDEKIGCSAGSDKGRPNGGGSVWACCTTLQEHGDRPAGLPPRCCWLESAPTRLLTVRRVAARSLAKLHQTGDARTQLIAWARVRHHPGRARVDCARRAFGLTCSAFAPVRGGGGAGARQPSDVKTVPRTVSRMPRVFGKDMVYRTHTIKNPIDWFTDGLSKLASTPLATCLRSSRNSQSRGNRSFCCATHTRRVGRQRIRTFSIL